MRESDIVDIVERVQNACTLRSLFLTISERLSAASYASARASHDFYEVVLLFSASDSVDKLPDVSERGYDSDPEFLTGKIECALSPAF